jgi:hypothetical protein
MAKSSKTPVECHIQNRQFRQLQSDNVIYESDSLTIAFNTPSNAHRAAISRLRISYAEWLCQHPNKRITITGRV